MNLFFDIFWNIEFLIKIQKTYKNLYYFTQIHIKFRIQFTNTWNLIVKFNKQNPLTRKKNKLI